MAGTRAEVDEEGFPLQLVLEMAVRRLLARAHGRTRIYLVGRVPGQVHADASASADDGRGTGRPGQVGALERWAAAHNAR